MMDQISICRALAKRNEIDPFLKEMVTGDEKRVTDYNIVRKQSWSKREVVFHQDNARPHTSVVTRQNLLELGWEVLMHPPYRPDLAPSDYHLFLVFESFLSYKKLESREDCENRLLDDFSNKGRDIYERGIMKLPLKWLQIIQPNGAYLTQIGLLEACLIKS
ncbi:histone-lysine N-methyltransferase SETMAR [Trichonephila clavipes]|nr:histone-lysine N-methyltransferase SETMAR [Trichonephila clavipes]